MVITSYKKADGKTYYMFKISLPTDPRTGKRKHTARRGFKTKKDAEIAYLRLIAAEDEVGKSKRMTFAEVYEVWMGLYKLRVKESTLSLHSKPQ
ncbi:Arm DNA-binding domain-containing protein [Guggenheimella bovis]